MMSLSDDKQADIIEAFNTISRYLINILNISNIYFDNMLSQIYLSELQLNTANTSDTEAFFWICICPFLQKFTINVTSLILKLPISHFKMMMFFVLHPMEFVLRNSSNLLEHLAMLQTSVF